MSESVVAREPTWLGSLLFRVRCWWTWNVSRKFPRLVWYGDELDVVVTFREAKLQPLTLNPEDRDSISKALAYLNTGHLSEVERALGEIGVEFDKGGGCDGRDWEWDYSLRGPISVRFKGRAQKPELRR